MSQQEGRREKRRKNGEQNKGRGKMGKESNELHEKKYRLCDGDDIDDDDDEDDDNDDVDDDEDDDDDDHVDDDEDDDDDNNEHFSFIET
ncbi:hypothetical protein PoB_005463400 [Plakobranchus ocellatus]|uniref:Uncharacterized protein n=1 Tax=Plakobranchus ocellatus TaxID=259542 RepID=A0AAV4C6F0_9GAST|nr:hypothetical protein PoB_005463400 [Plakobranchus ocellatus]